MDRDAINRMLEQLDDDPELHVLQKQLSSLEEQIKTVVSEDAWDLVLEWEALWAQYVTICLEKLHRTKGTAEL
ncbi:hypothetical protein CIG75_17620 [Tumebacillus algifaecis]|uniref:Uncharacterized protein n=1 Tax=Tumebacillus algifaecis TaxID=1214604 RepID=A0A223D5G5_9BACL|nr:hypothetical protein [Tumebacillus algifaecis]ASS76604.1 hypothetical protein CIG75_17620 [Tumebacillus algifaecis]